MISIKEIIDKWDPIDLLPYAPNDEYDSECKMIQGFIDGCEELINIEILGALIKDVFEKRFGVDVFKKDLNECKKIASNIIKELTV